MPIECHYIAQLSTAGLDRARCHGYPIYLMWAILFFIGGFLFDVITLDRVDSPFSVIQQVVYLSFVTLMLKYPSMGNYKFLNWYQKYHSEILHFVLGSLLSVFTLLYFKSASLSASIWFMLIMTFMLIINETKRFHTLSRPFKMALLTLCWITFFSFMVPTFYGSIGFIPFLMAVILGVLPPLTIKTTPEEEKPHRLAVLGTAVVIILLYALKLVPPVPVSMQYAGIYHDVRRQNGDFQLVHERKWWRFWHNGDQVFKAQTADRIFAYFEIYSPAKFDDQTELVWEKYLSGDGWTEQDRVRLHILGGRDGGFRTYATKSNYDDGEWRVRLLTLDQREIGRLYFNIRKVPSTPRTFEIEKR